MNIAHILKANIAGKIINHLLVFVMNVAMVRMLGVNQSGSYFNELYILNFFAFLFSFGLDFATIASVSKDPSCIPVLHRLFFRLGLIVALLIFGISHYLLPITTLHPIQNALTITLFAAGNLWLILYQGLLSACRRFNAQNLILISTNLLFLIWILFQSKKAIGVEEMSSMYAGLIACQAVIMMIISQRPGEAKSESVKLRQLFSYGLQIMASSLVYFVFLRADNFFVEHYSNPEVLSNYVQCGKVGQYFIYFSSVISSTLIPFIASEQLARTYKDWLALMRPYVLIILGGAILVCFSGKWLFPIVFGDSFSGMYAYMNILMPGYVCLGILTLMNAVYLGKGDVKTIFKGDLIAMILLLLLDAFIVPKYGATAAAIISSACYFLLCLYLWLNLKKHFNQPA